MEMRFEYYYENNQQKNISDIIFIFMFNIIQKIKLLSCIWIDGRRKKTFCHQIKGSDDIYTCIKQHCVNFYLTVLHMYKMCSVWTLSVFDFWPLSVPSANFTLFWTLIVKNFFVFAPLAISDFEWTWKSYINFIKIIQQKKLVTV